MPKVSIDVPQARSIYRALKSLDGYGSSDSRVIYKFSPPVQLKIARAMARLANIISGAQQEKDEVIRRLDTNGINLSDPNISEDERCRGRECLRQMSEIDERVSEVILPDLKVSDLKITKNSLPSSVIADLALVLVDLEKDGEGG